MAAQCISRGVQNLRQIRDARRRSHSTSPHRSNGENIDPLPGQDPISHRVRLRSLNTGQRRSLDRNCNRVLRRSLSTGLRRSLDRSCNRVLRHNLNTGLRRSLDRNCNRALCRNLNTGLRRKQGLNRSLDPNRNIGRHRRLGLSLNPGQRHSRIRSRALRPSTRESSTPTGKGVAQYQSKARG